MNGQLVCGMGYGMQPTFVNCADFTILAQGAPIPADFHWPDYNSVYATIHGGHTGSGTTPGKHSIVVNDDKLNNTSPITRILNLMLILFSKFL